MEIFESIWPLCIGVPLLAWVLWAAFGRKRKPRDEWRTIHVGQLDKVTYGGAAQGFWEDGDYTTLTFVDGHSVAIPGKVELPDLLGLRISVRTDDDGCYSYERAEPACGPADDECCGKGCHDEVPG